MSRGSMVGHSPMGRGLRLYIVIVSRAMLAARVFSVALVTVTDFALADVLLVQSNMEKCN